MNRAAKALLLGGVVLLATWVVAPAAPGPPAATADPLASLDQTTPVVAEVNAQVDRLRERLAAPPELPPPARDPFRFGERRDPRRVVAPVEAPAIVPPLEPAPPLPVLIAITSNTIDGTLTRTAVFAEGEEVRIVKEGDTVGRFLVQTVSADAAELLDKMTSRTHRVTLK
jgi:hypothetical protein